MEKQDAYLIQEIGIGMGIVAKDGFEHTTQSKSTFNVIVRISGNVDVSMVT
jgi:hypothetical protein